MIAACGMQNGTEARIRNPQWRGFTLIELMIVIVVLGLMLTFVMPRLGELGEANLKQSARHLTGMIRFLRDESQATKKMYRLRFDVPGGRYWAEVLTPSPDGKTAEFKRFRSTMADESSLSGQTSFRDIRVAGHPDEPYIQFSPDGWVERAIIHLRDGDNKDFTLWVKPLMGETELRIGYEEER